MPTNTGRPSLDRAEICAPSTGSKGTPPAPRSTRSDVSAYVGVSKRSHDVV
jgi:hypothetical protein